MTSPDRSTLAYALAHGDLLVERDALLQATARMAGEIARDFAGSRPVFLTVMHGGMLFAADLALALGAHGLDLEFDYLHATRYRGATSGGTLHWLRRPQVELAGKRVILVDDILDEGHTLAAIIDEVRAAGAAEVRIAAMSTKDHGRVVPGLAADYVGVVLPDRYVFGYGMDYHEQGRNLPAIWALKEGA